MRSPLSWLCLLVPIGCVAPQTADSTETPAPPVSATSPASPDPEPSEPDPVALVPVPAGYTCAPPSVEHSEVPKPPRELPMKGGVPVVDGKTCDPGLAFMPGPMGHRSVEVLGKREGVCTVEVTDEIEGGYTVDACRIPNKRSVLIPPGYEEGPGCERVRSGNVFFDDKPIVAPKGVSLQGHGFATRVHELEQGSETSLQDGGRARLELRFFGDREFAQPIGEGPQTVTVELEAGSAPTLSRALLDHSADLYRAKVGSVRRVILREEVAPELAPFGPFSDTALLCVEVRVLGFEPRP